ncbi:DNA-binding NarL/FixJ family response regulator [Arthrobacter sp. CAN_A2]|uniref:LuxR C-terminal-related transcriptional regulator n=1 Tax=Arthrobacter sp. CAN_A2 TaxID=2787718 RepID=UPI0018F0343E
MLPAFTPRPLWSEPGSTGSESGARHEQSVQHRVLTDRQESIAAMIVRGLTCQDMSRALHLPLRTIEGHVHLIIEALGLDRLEDLTENVTGSRR